MSETKAQEKHVEWQAAVCDYCKREVELLESAGELRFVTHFARNGRPCYNAYGKPKGEIIPKTRRSAR